MASGILNRYGRINLKKDLGIIFGLFLVIAGLVVFGKGFTSAGFLLSSNQATNSAVSVKPKDKVAITAGSLVIDAQVAATANDRKRGLSKKDSLPINTGMLFVFDKSDKWAIWMKNMKLTIDIVWIDENKKIIDIVKDAAPEPDKKDQDLTVYRPMADAKYVLEINAGIVDLNNVKVGDTVAFELQ